MIRTTSIPFAGLAGVALATGVLVATTVAAQTRHDDKQHGYDAKTAARQAQPPAEPTKYVVLPTGPRGHDSALRGRKIAVTPQVTGKPAAAPPPASK